jgi:AbrB family looped-hinge helix DNA binding protein
MYQNMCEIEVAKVLKDGKMTIPAIIREELDIAEGDTILFERMDTGVLIKKGLIIEAPRKSTINA